MAIYIVPHFKNKSFRNQIEEDAHRVASIRKVSFYKYVEAVLAAEICRMSYTKFVSQLRESKTLHGFRIYTGDIFVHPDELIAKARRSGARFCANIAKQSAALAENIENKKITN